MSVLRYTFSIKLKGVKKTTPYKDITMWLVMIMSSMKIRLSERIHWERTKVKA